MKRQTEDLYYARQAGDIEALNSYTLLMSINFKSDRKKQDDLTVGKHI